MTLTKKQIYFKQYYQKHKTKLKKRAVKWMQDNKETINAKMNARYHDPILGKKIKKQIKDYYKRNAEKIRAKSREYYWRNK